MKKLILTIGLVMATAAVASAQGTIKFFNATTAYLVSTNGSTIGKLSQTANSYYFALLLSDSAPSGSNPLVGWSVAQVGGVNLMATNYTAVAGGINGTGGTTGTAVDGWTAGATKYVEIVGWSANLGTTWASIVTQLQNGWDQAGFYGISSIGQVASGGVGTPASAAASLFGSTGQIGSGWTLNAVTPTQVPEPGTLALAGLGGLALLALRRRK